MTKEDAIKTLKELWRETNDPWYEEVYNMAINALEADRKTENSSEKSNNCETCRHYTLACDLFSEICRYEPKTEPQTDIHDLTDCDFCKDRNCKDCEGGKDEPQMERHLPDYSYEADLGRRIMEQTMRDENYIYAYDKTHGEWYPIQEIERPCDNCQEWDCYGCDYKQ